LGEAGATCTLEVWAELSSRGRRMIRCRIVDAPAELPDGAYRLEFAGHWVVTNKYMGAWELTFLWPQLLRELSQAGKGAA